VVEQDTRPAGSSKGGKKKKPNGRCNVDEIEDDEDVQLVARDEEGMQLETRDSDDTQLIARSRSRSRGSSRKSSSRLGSSRKSKRPTKRPAKKPTKKPTTKKCTAAMKKAFKCGTKTKCIAAMKKAGKCGTTCTAAAKKKNGGTCLKKCTKQEPAKTNKGSGTEYLSCSRQGGRRSRRSTAWLRRARLGKRRELFRGVEDGYGSRWCVALGWALQRVYSNLRPVSN
jgi:hypothetical protein